MSSPGPFPLEITQLIVYYLTHVLLTPGGEPPRPGFFSNWFYVPGSSRYATVNKAWQVAVERETFAELRLDLERLADAEIILNRVPRRQKYVRKIKLEVILPAPDTTLPYPHLETTSERKQKNHELEKTFVAFLSTLKDWTPGPPVKLHIDALGVDYKNRPEKTGSSQLWEAHLKYNLPVELEDPERILRLGPVNVVTDLEVEKNILGGKRISPAAVCTMLARLPAAKNVSMPWWDAKENPKSRTDLNQALTHVAHAIDSFNIGATYPLPWHELPVRQAKQIQVKPDELSRTLGMMSQRLETLDLYTVAVSDEIFLQPDLVPDMTSPAHWPRLKNFLLNYPLVTPSGEWLFYRDPNVPDDEQGAVVAYDTLQKWYLAAARAALEMPVLENMMLEANMEREEDWHKFWYNYNKEDKVAKAVWTSSSGFVPEYEVLEAWKEVPRKHHRVELTIEIVDDQWAV